MKEWEVIGCTDLLAVPGIPRTRAVVERAGEAALYTMRRDLDGHGCLDVMWITTRDLDGHGDPDVIGDASSPGRRPVVDG